jgi:hypothetical protein
MLHFVMFVIYPQHLVRNSEFGYDGRHPAGVPVVREAVSGDVLTHGGHHDPVAGRHSARPASGYPERAEQVALGHLPVALTTGRAAVDRKVAVSASNVDTADMRDSVTSAQAISI